MEILPGDSEIWLSASPNEASSTQQFLFVEGNIGIPQKVLYAAYLASLPIFWQAKREAQTLWSLSDIHTSQAAVDLLHSSAILLLANPDYQTALNARKQLVMHSVLDCQRELLFTTALLSVRECAKQSILWHHRMWLLKRIYHDMHGDMSQLDSDGGSLCDIKLPPDVLREEFALASRACEVYRRNYHGWTHRCRCLQSLVAALSSNTLALQDATQGDNLIGLRTVLNDEFAFMKTWIDRHISDYSAMDYMCKVEASLYLLEPRPDPDPSRIVTPIISTSFPPQTEEHRPENRCWSHAESLVNLYPDHEALWLYLRGAVPFRRFPSTYIQSSRTYVLSSSSKTPASPAASNAGAPIIRPSTSISQECMMKARNFARQYMYVTYLRPTISKVEAHFARKYACHFAAWIHRQVH